MTTSPGPASPSDAQKRVRAEVALTLFEVIRAQDLPGDVMEDEDPSVTMPRRLGLSGVVDRQIRSYRADVKKGVRLSDREMTDLFRLVIRRPDAEDVFLEVGRRLGRRGRRSAFRRVAPQRIAYALGRSRVRRDLKRLFGRPLGGFGRGSFAVEGRGLPFVQADPGGAACQLMTGFCEVALAQAAGRPVRARHTLCQARGDDLCRWEAAFGGAMPDAATAEAAGAKAGGNPPGGRV